jgi:hypothetical protein
VRSGAGPGRATDHRVAAGVDDAALGREGLRGLVGLARQRETGPDLDELPEAGLGDEQAQYPLLTCEHRGPIVSAVGAVVASGRAAVSVPRAARSGLKVRYERAVRFWV